MKFLAITFSLAIFSSIAVAQRVATPVSGITDTVRSDVYKEGKVKMVNGIAINSGRDIVQNLANAPDYSLYVKALRACGLIQTVKSRGPITFFVPDNKAFAYLPAGKTDTLLRKSHVLELTNMMAYHAVAGNLSAKDITKLINDNNGTAELTTIAGGKLTAHIDANRNIVLVDDNGNESIISNFDIPQNNGIAHLITRVLVPKYKVI
ncbi:fasciclin domain-containing protein [Mucilaginibacter koreensis]